MTEDIKKALQEARENKQVIVDDVTPVEWEILITTQVAKRNSLTGSFSELTIMKINNELFSVVHHMNKMPSPEKVFHNLDGDYRAVKGSLLANVLVEGVVNYRNNNLEKEYVNMYSYLWGYCSYLIDLKKFDLF